MLRLKFLYKTNCSWQNFEFLRITRSNPNIDKYLFHTKKITRIEQENWYYETYAKDPNFLIWFVYDIEMQVPIGYVQYHIESLIHRRCSVGYVIAPEFSIMKKKYELKIVKMMIKNVKGWKDNIHRLEIKIFPEDVSRFNSLTNCGFEVDGIIRDYIFKNFVPRDVYLLSYLL